MRGKDNNCCSVVYLKCKEETGYSELRYNSSQSALQNRKIMEGEKDGKLIIQ